MNILALSGSLRSASINSVFCRAAARLAQPPVKVQVFTGLGHLPLFNPDLEDDPPQAVLEFRAAIATCSALLIASPEYAHGISGVMKNALDWLVSFPSFVNKPVALVNTSPRARHAHDALAEVLRTMSASLIPTASISLPLLGAGLSEDQMVNSREIASRILGAIAALQNALSVGGEPGPNLPIG